jgi:hypothetical protein
MLMQMDNSAANANQTVAAFLISRPPYAYLGWGWESDDASSIHLLFMFSLILSLPHSVLCAHSCLFCSLAHPHLTTAAGRCTTCSMCRCVDDGHLDAAGREARRGGRDGDGARHVAAADDAEQKAVERGVSRALVFSPPAGSPLRVPSTHAVARPEVEMVTLLLAKCKTRPFASTTSTTTRPMLKQVVSSCAP